MDSDILEQVYNSLADAKELLIIAADGCDVIDEKQSESNIFFVSSLIDEIIYELNAKQFNEDI